MSLRGVLARTPLLLLFAAIAFSADLPDQWRSWRYSRSIVVPDTTELAKVSIPLNLYPRLGHGFSDLRIIEDAGAETPFVLNDENVRTPAESRHAAIREHSFVPGNYTQLVMDLGHQPSFHNALEIGTSENDFIDWVEIAASDDATTWRIVKDRAPISSFRKENISGSRQVRYSDNNARFLRVRIFEPAHPFPVTSVEVFFSREFHEPIRTSIPSQLTPDSAAPSSVSRWIIDLGSGSFPVSGVAIETPQPEFFRIVHMQISEDAKDWQDYFAGQVYRYKQADKQAESLRVYSQESWHRFWRIEIVNGNDAPLIDARPTLLAIPDWITFRPQSGHSYRLIYGNSSATPAHYDLSRTLGRRAETAAVPAALAAEEQTSNYLDPRPYTERHSYILWFALVVAVVLLAFAALRALRSPKATQS